MVDLVGLSTEMKKMVWAVIVFVLYTTTGANSNGKSVDCFMRYFIYVSLYLLYCNCIYLKSPTFLLIVLGTAVKNIFILQILTIIGTTLEHL